MKPMLAIDFDGVIHSYTGGDGEFTPPVPGAIDFILRALERFEVCIYSTRCGHPQNILGMQVYLSHHGLPPDALRRLKFPVHKPPAHVFLDDRAVRFDGEWPELDALADFQPWNAKAVTA